MDHGIFNVHKDVNASDCTRECTDTVNESALKIPLPHRGIESVSATYRFDALPTELHPHPASFCKYYIYMYIAAATTVTATATTFTIRVSKCRVLQYLLLLLTLL